MEGDDVAVLNGIVKSKAYGSAVRFGRTFTSPTASAVAEFQRRVDLRPSGVATKVTARALTASMRRAGATWYGPGFYGRRTACGQVLRRGTIGVAHKTLRCGTLVTFSYHGRSMIAPVIDRGPFTAGNAWDLTNGLRRMLGFGGSDQIRYAVAR
jgi:rare lipoprotein A (peptidoglycan hydrolase)